MLTDDLFEIANGFNNALLILQKKNIDDIKKRFTINIRLPLDELHQLDYDLYKFTDGKAVFTPSDEIRVTIMGIDFVIVAEEEKKEEKETN